MASFIKMGSKTRVQVRRRVKGGVFVRTKTLSCEEEARAWAAEMEAAVVTAKAAGMQWSATAHPPQDAARAQAVLDGSYVARDEAAKLISLALSAKELSNDAGVYFLYARCGRIVYVGQSRSVLSRMSGHSGRDFAFARMVAIEGKDQRLAVEARLIELLQPEINIAGRGRAAVEASAGASFVSRDCNGSGQADTFVNESST